MKGKTLNLLEQCKAIPRPAVNFPEISDQELMDRLARGLEASFWAEASQCKGTFATCEPLTPDQYEQNLLHHGIVI